jgi:hypothetical protein
MNRKLLFVILILSAVIFTPRHLSAQRILGAVSAGINLTQVDGDEKYGFHHVGFNGGPSIIIPFGKNKKWSVTMELLFSQYGSYQRSEYAPSDSIQDSTQLGFYDGYKLHLNYVQVPVMVHFTDKKVIAGGVGFLYGQLVGAKEWEDYNDERGFVRTETNLQGPYSMSDFQVLADVRIRLWQRLWVDVRYAYSILPIRTRVYINPFTQETWTRQQYNNVITLRLTYIFNQPIEKKAKKKKEG